MVYFHKRIKNNDSLSVSFWISFSFSFSFSLSFFALSFLFFLLASCFCLPSSVELSEFELSELVLELLELDEQLQLVPHEQLDESLSLLELELSECFLTSLETRDIAGSSGASSSSKGGFSATMPLSFWASNNRDQHFQIDPEPVRPLQCSRLSADLDWCNNRDPTELSRKSSQIMY